MQTAIKIVTDTKPKEETKLSENVGADKSITGTYPKGFSDLFGVAPDIEFIEPEDIEPKEVDFNELKSM